MSSLSPLQRICIALVLCGAVTQGAPKKWHPGHYMLVYNDAPRFREKSLFFAHEVAARRTSSGAP